MIDTAVENIIYDKRAKNLRYKSDKRGFQQTRWEDLTAKEEITGEQEFNSGTRQRDELRSKKEKAQRVVVR